MKREYDPHGSQLHYCMTICQKHCVGWLSCPIVAKNVPSVHEENKKLDQMLEAAIFDS